MKPCSMGVGCDEAGICFAAANGDPWRCPELIPIGYQFAGCVSRGMGPDMICWIDCIDTDTRWAFDGVQIYRQKGGQTHQWHRTDRVPFNPIRITQMGEMLGHWLNGLRTMTKVRR